MLRNRLSHFLFSLLMLSTYGSAFPIARLTAAEDDLPIFGAHCDDQIKKFSESKIPKLKVTKHMVQLLRANNLRIIGRTVDGIPIVDVIPSSRSAWDGTWVAFTGSAGPVYGQWIEGPSSTRKLKADAEFITPAPLETNDPGGLLFRFFHSSGKLSVAVPPGHEEKSPAIRRRILDLVRLAASRLRKKSSSE